MKILKNTRRIAAFALVVCLLANQSFGFELFFRGSPISGWSVRQDKIVINDAGAIVYSFSEIVSDKFDLYYKGSPDGREIKIRADTLDQKIDGRLHAIYLTGNTLKIALERKNRLYLENYRLRGELHANPFLEIDGSKLLDVSKTLHKEVKAFKIAGRTMGAFCCLTVICIPAGCRLCAVDPDVSYRDVHFNSKGEVYGKAVISDSRRVLSAALFVENEGQSTSFKIDNDKTSIDNLTFLGDLNQPSIGFQKPDFFSQWSGGIRMLEWNSHNPNSQNPRRNPPQNPTIRQLDQTSNIVPFLVNPDRTIEAEFTYREDSPVEKTGIGTIDLEGNKYLPSNRFSSDLFENHTLYAFSPDQTKVLVRSKTSNDYSILDVDPFLIAR